MNKTISDKAVKGLGKIQKEVLKFLLKGCEIHKSICTSTGETIIAIIDKEDNWHQDVLPKTLKSLLDRGLLQYQDETMCLQLEGSSYRISQGYKSKIIKAINNGI